MKITIKLLGLLRKGRFDQETREYADGSTVRDVVNDIDCPVEKIGIVLLNGEHATLEHLLKDGDKLSVLSILHGG